MIVLSERQILIMLIEHYLITVRNCNSSKNKLGYNENSFQVFCSMFHPSIQYLGQISNVGADVPMTSPVHPTLTSSGKMP